MVPSSKLINETIATCRTKLQNGSHRVRSVGMKTSNYKMSKIVFKRPPSDQKNYTHARARDLNVSAINSIN